MKLVSISIEKLFGQFDYNIEFNQEEGITILTGPNGYGKTTILNIIWSLFTYGDLSYIPGGPIPISKVSLSLSDGRTLKFPENKNDIMCILLEGPDDVKIYPQFFKNIKALECKMAK